MLRLKPLRAQVLVITGASSGIGLTTARLAARRGARLVLVARSTRALADLVGEIGRSGGAAIAVTADVSRLADVEHVADEACRRFGGFDTWINNAAVSAYGACTEVSLEDMRRIMDTNFWGVVHGCRVACAHLRTRGGAVINLGSVLSDRAAPLQAAYSASKHAIKAWTDSLRDELTHARAPIAVTLIKPGAIDTPYAEHAKNYFQDHPTHIPPVYHPRSVAEAILHAAAHPTRDIAIGSGSLVLSLASVLLPHTIDRFMTDVLLPGVHSGEPPRGRATLYEPGEDLRERGTYRGLVRPSLYTAVRTRPVLERLIGCAAALLLVAGAKALSAPQSSRSAGSARANTRRSTVRAAQ
jgi:short-subunit dehydrogenase